MFAVTTWGEADAALDPEARPLSQEDLAVLLLLDSQNRPEVWA